MNRYWDLSEKKRSQLSSDEVESFLSVELMEVGVTKPREPQLTEVKEIELETEEWFRIGSGYDSVCVVRTIEQAQAIVNAKPFKSDYDYQIGDNFKFAKSSELTIEPIQLHRQADVSQLKPKLEAIKQSKDRNVKEQKRYEKECEAMRNAVDGVWEDWHTQRATNDEAEAIQKTFEEYVELCEGDLEKAAIFLCKAKGREVVETSFAWLEIEITLPEPETQPAA